MAPSPSRSSHKPRRGRPTTPAQKVQARPSPPEPAAKHIATAASPAFPLAAFLWPARGGTSQWIVLPLVLMIVGLYRWTAGFWNYSGFNSPPMHGDFEAQRHWMEITRHLPITQWYFHDLEWWGLDYPPLTAYHSWLIGKIGSFMNPQWFELHKSRGLDDQSLKIFMRASVLVSEYLSYIPAVVIFTRRYARHQLVSSWEASVALIAILMQPGTILIDHAHFQFNTVMLGLFVASVTCLVSKRFFWACVFFVSALGFKQMALYYAPVIFAYILGSCCSPKPNLIRLFGVTVTTLISFALLFLPLLGSAAYTSYTDRQSATLLPAPPLLKRFELDTNSILYGTILQLAQCLHRVFPFARGVFEDKVANFWCALHTFYKLRSFPTSLLQRLSLGATAISILPPSLATLLYPRPQVLIPALGASAWGFFLFSFQVHEKSVLLPLLPMTLLLVDERVLQPPDRAWLAWANILGSWTMFPLLKRDELRVPYFVLTLLWAWLLGAHTSLLPSPNEGTFGVLTRLFHGSYYFVMMAWHIGEAFVPPLKNKPDTWVVVNVLIGAAGFGICYAWCLWRIWIALPLSQRAAKSVEKAKTR